MKSKYRLKFLTYALVLSLSTSSLTGCVYINSKYTTSEDGKVTLKKTSYDVLSEHKIIELRLINGESKLFIVNENNRYDYSRYYDIFTNKLIFTSLEDNNDQITLVKKSNLIDYLVTYNEIKDIYTKEDVERIYDKIVESYEFEKEKIIKK